MFMLKVYNPLRESCNLLLSYNCKSNYSTTAVGEDFFKMETFQVRGLGWLRTELPR